MACTVFLSFVLIASILAQDIVVEGDQDQERFYFASHTTSVFDQNDLLHYDSYHIEDLVDLVPNMNSSKGSSRSRFFQIRGVGERSSFEAISNYSVGIMIDDIDYTGVPGVGILGGISQVEVYSGPQSTRFGPSALAGMIHFKSEKATREKLWQARTSIGTFNTYNSSLNYSAPIGKKSAISIGLIKNLSDGFMINNYLKLNDTNKINESGARLKILGRNYLGDIEFNANLLNADNGYDAFTQDNSLTTNSDRPGFDQSESFASSLKLTKKFTEKMTSTSTVTFLKSRHDYGYDEDWGNNKKWLETSGWNANYDYNILFDRKRLDYTFDQRFNMGKRYRLGLYLKRSMESFLERGFENNIVRKEILGRVKTNIASLYFSEDTTILNYFSLQYGVRGEYRHVEYSDNFNNLFKPREFMYAFDINLSKDLKKDNKVLLKIAKGYKAGGINTQNDVSFSRKVFSKEDLYSLEIGHQKRWQNINLKNHFTAFYMFRDNAQVNTSFQDDPLDPSSYTFYIDNATQAHHFGLEWLLEKKFLEKWTLKSNLSFLKTKFSHYEIGGRLLNGRELPHAPHYKGFFNIKYDATEKISLITHFNFSDNFYFSNSHDTKSKTYQTMDLQIVLEQETHEIRLWCKNIFNELQTQRGFFFSNEPPLWEERQYIQREAPRTYGVSAYYRF